MTEDYKKLDDPVEQKMVDDYLDGYSYSMTSAVNGQANEGAFHDAARKFAKLNNKPSIHSFDRKERKTLRTTLTPIERLRISSHVLKHPELSLMEVGVEAGKALNKGTVYEPTGQKIIQESLVSGAMRSCNLRSSLDTQKEPKGKEAREMEEGARNIKRWKKEPELRDKVIEVAELYTQRVKEVREQRRQKEEAKRLAEEERQKRKLENQK